MDWLSFAIGVAATIVFELVTVAVLIIVLAVKMYRAQRAAQSNPTHPLFKNNG